jgi:hypothetical protein
MTHVRATVILEIDETDEERLKNNAAQFLRQSLVEKAPSEEVEGNAIRDKPVFTNLEVDTE